MLLKTQLSKIKSLNANMMDKAQKRLDSLTKPLGSLGKLEEISKKIVGITGEMFPKVDNKCVIIMCADNGIYDKNVSSCPKSVTAQVTKNFTKGITGVSVLAKLANSDIHVVDVGVDADIDEVGIVNKKIRKSTWDITEGPGMTRDEAIQAIQIGIDTVKELKDKGYNLFGTGEMGIANTSTSAAVVAAITKIETHKIVGLGAGLTKEGFQNKIKMVQKALDMNKPDANDGIDVLSKVGGFDIAALTGCFIGAAIYRVPILIDGFISSAAALAAITIKPEIKDFIFTSHGSAEYGSNIAFEALDMEPMLHLGMRLGEGTGAAIGFYIMDAAMAIYTQMGTFDDAHIEDYVPLP